MRLKIALMLFTLALVAAVLTGKKPAELSAIDADDKQPAPGGSRAPVLVELFTSEGCSSCPPADELLTRLEQTQPVDGAEVIALSEHVDYWNRLGWTDPYSSAEFSARQNDYARVFNTDGVYTPQMIVDGRAQFVGSNLSRAREAIANASHNSKVKVEVSLASDDQPTASITLDVRAERPQSESGSELAEVLLAITERGLRSSVSRGENAGRRLSHTAVVRKLITLGSVDSQGAAQFAAKPVVQIDKGWKRDNLNAVAFVQERSRRRVLGASSVSLLK